MTDLEKLEHVFDDIGIKYYCVRSIAGYYYIFLGKRINEELSILLATNSFFEFTPEGEIASY